MPSKSKPKDPAADLAKALERIEVLEAQVASLKRQVLDLATRPDPFRPIGPRPGDPRWHIPRVPERPDKLYVGDLTQGDYDRS